jgi:hypothetical protein
MRLVNPKSYDVEADTCNSGRRLAARASVFRAAYAKTLPIVTAGLLYSHVVPRRSKAHPAQ